MTSLDLANDNGEILDELFGSYPSVAAFLSDEVIIPVHSTAVEDPEDVLDFSYDIDGIVIEVGSLQAIKARIPYLKMPAIRPYHLHGQFSYLKKHLVLSELSGEAYKCVQLMLGVTIAHVADGYFLDLSLLPKDIENPDRRLADQSWVKEASLRHMQNIQKGFVVKIQGLSVKDKCRPTIQKNSPSNLKNMNVLEKDQDFIMGLLDSAIRDASEDSFFRVLITLQKFGMKSERGLEIDELVDQHLILKTTIHVACNVGAKDPDILLMWARNGIEQMSRSDGTLYTALGIHETVNFQTVLDNHANRLSRALKVTVMDFPVLFVQLYVDSPHIHVKSPFKHPVTGTIVTCGLSHPQYANALEARATNYLDHMQDLSSKMICPFHLRLEYVLFLEDIAYPKCVEPSWFFVEEHLLQFFEENPVVLPYRLGPYNQGVLVILSKVMDFLVQSLSKLHVGHRNRGGYEPSWKAFQLELALEELFYGHPLSVSDVPYSVSLGTSSSDTKSLAYWRGFIGLAR
ncbi:hypothetical protein EYF80_050298 [Liparis tanakae]|uniref:Uncharacterized protein n=1 Tax=Liparis tanakae TaxID=230148 RepID=A0A4Z2FGK8_9TELE|nr:hypothetical protein EYF80_050298 [Liparis tanakae]